MLIVATGPSAVAGSVHSQFVQFPSECSSSSVGAAHSGKQVLGKEDIHKYYIIVSPST